MVVLAAAVDLQQPPPGEEMAIVEAVEVVEAAPEAVLLLELEAEAEMDTQYS
jgi:hypothetical protein